jgi:hypothetical protein
MILDTIVLTFLIVEGSLCGLSVFGIVASNVSFLADPTRTNAYSSIEPPSAEATLLINCTLWYSV